MDLSSEKEEFMNKCEILQVVTVMLETLTNKINNYFEVIMQLLMKEFLDNDKLSYKLVVIQNVI